MQRYHDRLVAETDSQSMSPAQPQKTSLGYVNAGLPMPSLPSRYHIEDDLSWQNKQGELKSVDEEFREYGYGSINGHDLDMDLVKFWEVCRTFVVVTQFFP